MKMKDGLEKIAFLPSLYIPHYVTRFFERFKYVNDPACRIKMEWFSIQKYRNSLVHKLRKKYHKDIVEIKDEIDRQYTNVIHRHDKTIWICWLQGMENAPELVNRCVESIYKHFEKDWTIVVITEDNLKSYIELPEYILTKYHAGIITQAFFSDLIRLGLLNTYGGTWVDATILCTSNNVPDYMMNSELFFFQGAELERNVWATAFESYFITAASNNRILLLTEKLILRHLNNVNILLDYHLFYDFLQIAINEYPEEFRKVVPCPRGITVMLAHGMFEQYDEEKYKNLISFSPFHKLSHKARYDEGSILDWIIKGKNST